MIPALDVRGGGGSPKELRSDAGVMVEYGIEETLKRHAELIIQDVSSNDTSVAGANTTGSIAFSFAQDHYIMGLTFTSATLPANVLFMLLELIPQNQTQRVVIAFTELADRITFTGVAGDDDVFVPHRLVDFPLFVRAQTDYFFSIRSGAGGGVACTIDLLRVEAPQGVEIAH